MHIIYIYIYIYVHVYRFKTLNGDQMNERSDSHDPVRYFVKKFKLEPHNYIKCQLLSQRRNQQNFIPYNYKSGFKSL